MQQWTEAFEDFAKKLLEESEVPGAVIAVARDGEWIYQESFGVRDQEQQLPLSMDTVFGIASVTKSFTCAAIMQLQEAGKLSVTDPVIRYLPEFRFLDDEMTNAITIEQFMAHTPGMPPLPYLDGAMKRSLEQDPAILGTEAEEELKTVPYLDTYAEVLEAIAKWKGTALGAPGTAFSYNNDGYGLLGAIIERVSNMSYEQYLSEHILGPLGMTRTVFAVEDLADSEDVATLYTRKKIDGNEQVIAAPLWHDAPAMRACGFLKSTARDLLTYLELFRTGGEAPASGVLSRESIHQMTTPHARCDGYRSYGYGLMVSPAFPGGALIEHGGSLKGISSHVFVQPQTGLSGVVLCNVDGVPVRDLVLGILNTISNRSADALIYPIEKIELPGERLREYVGLYKSQEWMKAEIVSKENELYLEADGQAYPLIPVGADSFVFRRGRSTVWIDFFRSAEGKVERMSYSLRQLTKAE
ncbi:penicillin-binding protein [Brevibacillus panacihumi W25]|uniref:Penicillin-binding protein n=1 Tax=Brevibacillus panacihumi W25 TaxID=1408254 RepID=V6M4X1_9BACL|nr:serine hydrolase [Brevibacillus panacihumi]EST53372.1 penicillin-binding protein [Brevibacillus panacihumi W25]